ncbi:YceD family protein [Actinomadura sp. NBRC 104412]|uniref:YceD family protein n=1 Tax=Actinomadura sp. NBRC 104412 TaxID=3032203 RepID=UPI002555D485|nr:YceD family protein [Actinomadura sp. NBRC 104412]
MAHESRITLSRLDPNAPLVLDTRALGRQPGSSREEVLTVPAPADLGVEMVGVPEGAAIELRLRLEAVLEGVLVTGTARAPLEGECARCLDPIASTFEADFQELFVYPDTRSGRGGGGPSPGGRHEQGADDEELHLEDDLIDLEPVLRDAVVLALPLSPLCRDDCPGLCPECGVRLADAEPDHGHAVADPRWEALRGLAGDGLAANGGPPQASPGGSGARRASDRREGKQEG